MTLYKFINIGTHASPVLVMMVHIHCLRLSFETKLIWRKDEKICDTKYYDGGVLVTLIVFLVYTVIQMYNQTKPANAVINTILGFRLYFPFLAFPCCAFGRC